MAKYPFIIAEIGLNHNGNFNLAKSIIEAAKAGVVQLNFKILKLRTLLRIKKLLMNINIKVN